MFSGRQPNCPSCGLEAGGPVAKELADLEITVARIQSLVDSGRLDPALGEQVYKSLEGRQAELLKGVAQPVPRHRELKEHLARRILRLLGAEQGSGPTDPGSAPTASQ